jgi:hypothetical protein
VFAEDLIDDRVEELRMVRASAFGERAAVLVGCSFGGQRM